MAIVYSNVLEEVYPGDAAWQHFAAVFAGEWHKCAFKEELVFQLSGNEDIAMVIYASIGDNAMAWLSHPVPALDQLSPFECMQNPRLIQRLKCMLMRMPR